MRGHSNFKKSFSLHFASRTRKVKQLKNQLIFLKTIDKNQTTTDVLHCILQIIGQRKILSGEEEMIIQAADSLFVSFRNKDELASIIKSMQLSAYTVTILVEIISNDFFFKVK